MVITNEKVTVKYDEGKPDGHMHAERHRYLMSRTSFRASLTFSSALPCASCEIEGEKMRCMCVMRSESCPSKDFRVDDHGKFQYPSDCKLYMGKQLASTCIL